MRAVRFRLGDLGELYTLVLSYKLDFNRSVSGCLPVRELSPFLMCNCKWMNIYTHKTPQQPPHPTTTIEKGRTIDPLFLCLVGTIYIPFLSPCLSHTPTRCLYRWLASPLIFGSVFRCPRRPSFLILPTLDSVRNFPSSSVSPLPFFGDLNPTTLGDIL